MKLLFISVFACLIAFGSSAYSQGSVSVSGGTETAPVSAGARTHSATFFFAPSTKYTFGNTEYIMDIRGFDPELGIARITSQLEFPLDGVLAGGTAGVYINRNGRPVWRFELGAWVNANDPGGTMFDHDWSNIYTGTYEKFSYTESEAEMKALMLNVRVARAVFIRPTWDISLISGVRYQKFEQDVIGFTGWQIIDGIGSRAYFDYPGLLGIVYEVKYLQLPQIGLMLNADLGRSAEIGMSGLYTYVMVDDVDDHVLRNKLSTADASGNGFIGDAYFEFSPTATLRHGLFFALSGEFAYYGASGEQTQEWYDDEVGIDPETEEEVIIVPKGTRIEDLAHEVNSTQFRIGLNVGFRF